MSALGDGLSAALGHNYGDDFGTALEEAKAAHGGVSGLARYLGVARTTVQRWQRGLEGRAGGTTPKAGVRGRVEQTAREHGTPRVRTGRLGFRVIGNDVRHRFLTPEQLRLPADAGPKAREKFIETGSAEAAAIELWRHIGDPFYKDFFFDDEWLDVAEYDVGLDSDYHAGTVQVYL